MEHSTRLAAALGLGAAVGCKAEDYSGLQPWGTPANAGEAEALLPEALRSSGTLEFYLNGGLNAFDTFYCVPEFGDPADGGPFAGQGWWAFQDNSQLSIPQAFEGCGGQGRPLLTPFARDAAGTNVQLGPFIDALRQRPDILTRMRLFVVRHDQSPHQGGNPIALSGLRFGNPRLAGTAAHVQRYYSEQVGRRALPYSHVILPRNRGVEINNIETAASIGLHGAIARPLVSWLQPNSEFPAQLERLAVQGRSNEVDALVQHYLAEHEARLAAGLEEGTVIRAPVLADYSAAREHLGESESLRALITPDAVALGSSDICGEHTDEDMTRTGLRLALRALLHEPGPARYAISVDGGFLPATGGGVYDTHLSHVGESARNVTHAMRQLVASINEPGEGDPGKLDLDKHTVWLHTEFGRSPFKEGFDGLDHWPQGYVVVAIGGWVDEERAGVVGSIGSGFVAEDWVTPGELRAAMLLSMGIWPFTPQSFAVGDVREGETELDSAMWLREHILGRPV